MFLNCKRLLSMIRDKIAFNIIRNQTYSKLAMTNSYEEAVICINSLQSNQAYIANATNKNILSKSTVSKSLVNTQKYLLRTGVSLNDLDKLSVIHVAGTKGKGSTCAFCDSILRQYGYKTGFYSSPHLVTIRERIRVNGKPLEKDVFAKYFFTIYKKLMDNRENPNDMPGYFHFLTILAFNVFLQENIDVVILEVGIGGEFDCTNIVRNTLVAGITSLGIDHTNILGNTIEQIAWQKAGIMKKNCKVFTVPQPETAMKVLIERSIEKESSLDIIPNFNEYQWEKNPPVLGINGEVQKINASLAIQLSHSWLKLNGLNSKLFVPEKTINGLENCKWPGRNQIIHKFNKTFFLDGAHTIESLEICVKWFKNISTKNSYKVLIFNVTGNRNSEELLKQLNTINFNHVCFVPNASSSKSNNIDQINIKSPCEQQLKHCECHRNIWLNLNSKQKQVVSIFSDVEEAVNNLPENVTNEVLITGSLHLIGAALEYLDPDLSTF